MIAPTIRPALRVASWASILAASLAGCGRHATTTVALRASAADASPPDAATETRAERRDPPRAWPPSAMATSFLANPAHTNAVSGASLAPPLTPVWRFEAAGVFAATYPLIASGRVYFVYGLGGAGAAQKLVAVDEQTGATIWGPIDLATDLVEGQAYDREKIFTRDGAGVVRSFDAASGAPGWTRTLKNEVRSTPPTARDGWLYTIASGALTALDEATGAVRWTSPVSDGAFAQSPAVTDDAVFVSSTCGNLTAFAPATGAVLWHHRPHCKGFAEAPIVVDGRVFLPEDPDADRTDVFDARSGRLLSELSCANPGSFDDGRGYCSPGDPGAPLFAFDLRTGARSWSFPGDARLALPLFSAGGAVYVASDAGRVFGVDEAAGAQLWSTQADAGESPTLLVGGEGILLIQLHRSGGFVAYAHVEAPANGKTPAARPSGGS